MGAATDLLGQTWALVLMTLACVLVPLALLALVLFLVLRPSKRRPRNDDWDERPRRDRRA